MPETRSSGRCMGLYACNPLGPLLQNHDKASACGPCGKIHVQAPAWGSTPKCHSTCDSIPRPLPGVSRLHPAGNCVPRPLCGALLSDPAKNFVSRCLAVTLQLWNVENCGHSLMSGPLCLSPAGNPSSDPYTERHTFVQVDITSSDPAWDSALASRWEPCPQTLKRGAEPAPPGDPSPDPWHDLHHFILLGPHSPDLCIAVCVGTLLGAPTRGLGLQTPAWGYILSATGTLSCSPGRSCEAAARLGLYSRILNAAGYLYLAQDSFHQPIAEVFDWAQLKNWSPASCLSLCPGILWVTASQSPY